MKKQSALIKLGRIISKKVWYKLNAQEMFLKIEEKSL